MEKDVLVLVDYVMRKRVVGNDDGAKRETSEVYISFQNYRNIEIWNSKGIDVYMQIWKLLKQAAELRGYDQAEIKRITTCPDKEQILALREYHETI